MRGSEHYAAMSVTTVLIVVLSLLTMVISIFYQQTKLNNKKREQYVYAIFFVIYVLGTCLSIQKLQRCVRTDPGFIPSKKALHESILDQQSLSKLKDENGKHYVQYQTQEDLQLTFQSNVNESMFIGGQKQDNPIQKFFSTKKFKYYDIPDSLNQTLAEKMNKITWCKECQVLRPPRSFHCSRCGMCVEVHDHHCWWVGTCIGKRNIKQFTQFLIFSGLHALFSTYVLISEIVLIYEYEEIEWIEMCSLMTLATITGIIAMILLPYGLSVLKKHSLNLTTNENLRARWNGHPTNKHHAQIHCNESSTFTRMKHVLTREMPDSKLHKVLKLTEIWKQKFGELKEEEVINLMGVQPISYDELLDKFYKDEAISKAQCLYVQENELSNWAILKSYGIDLPADCLTSNSGYSHNQMSIQ